VDLIGTVNVQNLGFYKFEVAPRNSETWSTIFAGRAITNNEKFGRWDTTEMTPGDYQLRLVVSDNQGNALPECIIPLRVKP
jgi:protocatechuate 3,4-dioxygenase beta subunit